MAEHASVARPLTAALALGMMAALGGCAAAPQSRPVADAAPPPAAVPTAEPQPPAGASAGLAIPATDSEGQYITPNRGLSAEATVWHVRSALNVAALGCRGPQEAALIADYNALLAGKRALLAAAFARTEAEARVADPKGWRNTHDRQMTQLYNFFAQPPAKAAFCAVAREVAAEAAVTPTAGFPAFAAAALPRLDAPFVAFYRAYDAYRQDLAAWRASGAPRLTYAPIAPADDAPDRRLTASAR